MKIAIVCSSFFGYAEKIESELKKKGHEVILIQEYPFLNPLPKVMSRLTRGKANFIFDRYYQSKFCEIDDFDFIIIIKGEFLSSNVVSRLVSRTKAKVIYYQWDSVKNNRNFPNIMSFGHKVFSFDKADCLTYGFEYLPLFHSVNTNEAINRNKSKYDVVFIGTVHDDRLIILDKLERILKDNNIKYLFYRYYPNKMIFKIRKMIDFRLFKIDTSNITFEPLQYQEYNDIISNSLVCVDIHRSIQSGVTMRTIEAIAQGTKVMTTNTHVKDDPLFAKNEVFTFDRNVNFDTNSFINFINEKGSVNTRVVMDLHISNWVDKLISDN